MRCLAGWVSVRHVRVLRVETAKGTGTAVVAMECERETVYPSLRIVAFQ